MTAVNEEFDPGFVGLMDMAWRTVRRTLDARVRPRIEGELAGRGPHLRASHMRLLSLTPRDGIRLTDLATRATMTKQALGEFVATLQQAGLVEVTTDERDRRVRLARPTEAGRDVQKAIQECFAEIERRLRAEVGPGRWDTFREVLAEVGAITEA
jgi:DNA-binding MarR family transcriptional regulator